MNHAAVLLKPSAMRPSGATSTLSQKELRMSVVAQRWLADIRDLSLSKSPDYTSSTEHAGCFAKRRLTVKRPSR